MNEDDGCLFCTHARSAHTGCTHHGACCAIVDCTCISFTEALGLAKTEPPVVDEPPSGEREAD